MSDVKNLLVSAKNLINTSGWTQGDYGDADNGYCITGALGVAYDDAGYPYATYSAAIAAVKKTLKDSGRITNVPAWNDAAHRTQAEVLELLDEAATNA